MSDSSQTWVLISILGAVVIAIGSLLTGVFFSHDARLTELSVRVIEAELKLYAHLQGPAHVNFPWGGR